MVELTWRAVSRADRVPADRDVRVLLGGRTVLLRTVDGAVRAVTVEGDPVAHRVVDDVVELELLIPASRPVAEDASGGPGWEGARAV